MQTVHTHQSLMTRISETQRRAAQARDERQAPRRQKPSFVERYRGTEFEAASAYVAPVLTPEPVVSRGRLFVLVMGMAAIGLFGFIVTSPLLT